MVLTIKVPLKEAQNMRKELQSQGLVELDYVPLKEKNHFFIPMKKRIKSIYPFEDKKLEKILRNVDLKSALKEDLTKEELSHLKTAFDHVGTIAILEIDEILKKKEKIIAKKLLEINPTIKTVLKKSGSHAGEFRTQKMKFLAGVKTKETIHKENDIMLKLDVEKVYFSPRLSNERKRIIQQVKTDEEVLVMFSGSGIYPLVIAKNTKAKTVFGIEINPKGHEYGLENIKLNKIHNLTLINGDVKKIIPKFNEYIFGLKSNIKNKDLTQRLKLNPKIMEFHLFYDDLFSNKKELEKTIQRLQKKKIKTILHMPHGFADKSETKYSLSKKDVTKDVEMLKSLGDLCKKYDVIGIIHPTHNHGPIDERTFVQNTKKLKNYMDHFYFENETQGLFCKDEDISRIFKDAGIKNACIDTAHAYEVYNDTNRIVEHIKRLRQHFNLHFHIVDNDKKVHSCEIGKGLIDFDRILPYVNQGVVEVCSKDETTAVEMLSSYKKIIAKERKFDRILMPLPKSAEDFLDTALSVAKKGTIIHFYDFLNEAEFDLAKEKIRRACERNNVKFKILDLARCGQHAPHVYRICVDFQII